MKKKDLNPNVIEDVKTETKRRIKANMYDILAAAIVVIMFVVALGVMSPKELTWDSLKDVIVSWVPFFLTASFLNYNYYSKGKSRGKDSESFKTTIAAYSKQVGSITGAQMSKLPEFCKYYNQQALEELQTSILILASIPFERFDKVTYDQNGNELKPLKVLGIKDYKKLGYSREEIKIIVRAKHTSVQGIRHNQLLGNTSARDKTNIGHGEGDMTKARTIVSTVGQAVSMFILCMIGMKNIMEWGWVTALFVLFRMVWILCKSYLQYIKGYNDITIRLSNHIARKTDILKEFEYWYSLQPALLVAPTKKPEVAEQTIDSLLTENIT